MMVENKFVFGMCVIDAQYTSAWMTQGSSYGCVLCDVRTDDIFFDTIQVHGSFKKKVLSITG